MCFKIECLILALLCLSCSTVRKLENVISGNVGMSLGVPVDNEHIEEDDSEVVIDSIRGSLSDDSIIMNAIRDSETGEMVATDVIRASKVVARFRNVAERHGYVSVEFDVIVPCEMVDSKWQLKIYPFMTMFSRRNELEPIFITGTEYRSGQMRGYERYRKFLNSIVTDSLDFIRIHQLEIFLQRHFPDTYAMKNDTTVIPEPLAEDLFGVTQAEALEHYTKHLKKRINEHRKSRKSIVYKKYVKDPILNEGIRLDTVIVVGNCAFSYRYVHTFKTRPKLRRVMVSLEGDVYEDGKLKANIPFKDSLTYYISSLSTLVDKTPRYKRVVIERNVRDNTKALVEFEKGSSRIDTSLRDNSSELLRIRKCIDDIVAMDDLELDSLVITSSCSPEGLLSINSGLSKDRAEMMKKYLDQFVPEGWKGLMRSSDMSENWDQFAKLVESDTLLDRKSKSQILDIIDTVEDVDLRENKLSSLNQYKYLREKIYPQLRSVCFDFYLHRIGVQRDTIHTTELDSLYMRGVESLENMDYKGAVSILKPYRDYNSALALLSADYNHTALDVLKNLDEDDARVCYLKSIILARLNLMDEATKFLELSIAYDAGMEHRANLDPELYEIVKKRNYNLNEKNYD